jgi:membrane protein DedA with SNARE-associated domain
MLRAPMEQLFKDAAAPLTDFVQNHGVWAGPIVFLICFLESVAIVSAFIPATVLLLGIGGLATAGLLDLGEMSLWGIVGAGLGHWISYEGGRRYAAQIENIGWIKARPELLVRGHQFFERWGAMAVFVGRFIGPARVVTPMLAGTLGVEPRRFHLANWISAILWAPLLLAPTAIGVWISDQLEQLPPTLRGAISITVLAIAAIAFAAYRQRR